MINSNAPAYPCDEYVDHPAHGRVHRSHIGEEYSSGMTIRTEIASRIMAGFAADCNFRRTVKEAAELAIKWTDALIIELNKEPENAARN